MIFALLKFAMFIVCFVFAYINSSLSIHVTYWHIFFHMKSFIPEASDYIPKYLWDVINCLAQHSSYDSHKCEVYYGIKTDCCQTIEKGQTYVWFLVCSVHNVSISKKKDFMENNTALYGNVEGTWEKYSYHVGCGTIFPTAIIITPAKVFFRSVSHQSLKFISEARLLNKIS